MTRLTTLLRRRPVLIAWVAAVAMIAGCSASAPSVSQAPSWTLKVGPQGQNQPVVCAADRDAPCAISRGVGGQRIEAQTTVVLPGTANHRFTGELFVGFVGDDVGPAAHALRVDESTAPGASRDVTGVGLVTLKPGSYPIRVRLEETGSDLPAPRQHAIDIMVAVR